MRSRGWRQGRGRRAETVYLKPKKKASSRPAQLAPPLLQLFLKFGSLPAPWAQWGAATEPRAWHTQSSLRPALPDLLLEGALAQPGCCPLAPRRLTQCPPALGCVVKLLEACGGPFLAVSWSLRGQEVGFNRRAGYQRAGNFSVLLSHGTSATFVKQALN